MHVHAPFSTTLACLGRGIPAFHDMVAVAGGHDIRCAPYATFGTQALADGVLAEMSWRALQVREPDRLDDAEMARVVAKFARYGEAEPAVRPKARSRARR